MVPIRRNIGSRWLMTDIIRYLQLRVKIQISIYRQLSKTIHTHWCCHGLKYMSDNSTKAKCCVQTNRRSLGHIPDVRNTWLFQSNNQLKGLPSDCGRDSLKSWQLRKTCSYHSVWRPGNTESILKWVSRMLTDTYKASHVAKYQAIITRNSSMNNASIPSSFTMDEKYIIFVNSDTNQQLDQ